MNLNKTWRNGDPFHARVVAEDKSLVEIQCGELKEGKRVILSVGRGERGASVFLKPDEAERAADALATAAGQARRTGGKGEEPF